MSNQIKRANNAQYKEVSDKLKYIRRLLMTETGRKKVAREIRKKWL